MNLEFDQNAFDDLRYWVEIDRKKAQKILSLIEEIKRTPFTGTGKPEPLKHTLEKCWFEYTIYILINPWWINLHGIYQ